MRSAGRAAAAVRAGTAKSRLFVLDATTTTSTAASGSSRRPSVMLGTTLRSSRTAMPSTATPDNVIHNAGVVALATGRPSRRCASTRSTDSTANFYAATFLTLTVTIVRDRHGVRRRGSARRSAARRAGSSTPLGSTRPRRIRLPTPQFLLAVPEGDHVVWADPPSLSQYLVLHTVGF